MALPAPRCRADVVERQTQLQEYDHHHRNVHIPIMKEWTNTPTSAQHLEQVACQRVSPRSEPGPPYSIRPQYSFAFACQARAYPRQGPSSANLTPCCRTSGANDMVCNLVAVITTGCSLNLTRQGLRHRLRWTVVEPSLHVPKRVFL